jgi:glyoxylase-like metal-dependent hydrolase (beta-lactamase superfamily II)
MGYDTLPVCEAWFESERMGDDLFRMTEPHVGPLIASNIWLLLGEAADLLVDTGNGLARLRPFVQRLRPDPDKPLIAVATHAHMDHVCGLHEFDHRLLHRADVTEAVSPDRLLFAAEVWPGVRVQMAEAGYPLAHLGIRAAPERAFDPKGFTAPGAVPTRVLEEGDVIDLGDRSFDVLHLPGHTPGSIGLWDGSRGVLFSGDAVYAGEPLLDTAPTSAIPAYLTTMKRLREIPVEIVHGGHDMSFDRDTLIERCDAYIARRRGSA